MMIVMQREMKRRELASHYATQTPPPSHTFLIPACTCLRWRILPLPFMFSLGYLTKTYPVILVFHSISNEGKRDMVHLVDPSLFTPGSHKPPFVCKKRSRRLSLHFFFTSPNQRTESDHVCFLPLHLVLVNIHCSSVALRQASLFFIGSGLWASQAARYNDRYTTEEADSDPINLKQPLLLDPCLSLRSTPHAYKRTHLHALVLTSLKASVLVETCPVESIV